MKRLIVLAAIGVLVVSLFPPQGLNALFCVLYFVNLGVIAYGIHTGRLTEV